MKHILKLACFILFNSFAFCAAAQQSMGISESIDGYPFQHPIKVSDNEYVFACGKYGERSDLNLVKFNSSLAILWQKNLPDGVISISKWHNNILIFSTGEWEKNTYSNIKTIKAQLIDAKTGSSMLTSEIVKMDGNFFVQPMVLKDSLNNLKGLLLRYSNMEHVKTFKQEESFQQMRQTQKAEWLTFDDQLKVNSTTVLSNNFNGITFLAPLISATGNLFINAIENNTKLTVYKYAAGTGTPAETLSAALPGFSKDYRGFNSEIANDGSNELFSITYRTDDKLNNTVTAKFDFANNAAFSSVADPRAAMGLEKSKGMLEIFDQVGLDYYKDEVVTVQQYTSVSDYFRGNESYSVYNNDDLLVSFFDSKMNLVKKIPISKKFPVYLDVGTSPGYKIMGNKMIIVANAFTEKKFSLSSKYKLKYMVIDLDKMELITDNMIDVNNSNRSIVEASSTLWEGNTALIFHLLDKNLLSSKDFSVKLEKLSFNF